MSKKLTKEEVLKRFKLRHGDKYDYSNVVYVNADTPVEVYCPLRNEYFYPTPYDHFKKFRYT